MLIRRHTILLMPLFLALAACSTPKKEQQLQNEVQELTQKVEQLNTQAALLERQNTLNRQSEEGVYLLNGANGAALILTDVGQLLIRLDHVEPEADGSKAVLQIKNATGAILPAFSATLSWGKLNADGEPQSADAAQQNITFTPSAVPTNVTSMEVRLSDITPEALGYVYLHHFRPNTRR